MKSLALLLFLAASVFGQTIQERVSKFKDADKYEVKFDRFERVTWVKYRIDGDLKITASVALDSPPYFVLDFHVGPSVHPTLKLLIDGYIAPPLKTEGVQPMFTLPLKHLEAMTKAKTVEFQLGDIEGTFDASTLTALRNLAGLVK